MNPFSFSLLIVAGLMQFSPQVLAARYASTNTDTDKVRPLGKKIDGYRKECRAGIVASCTRLIGKERESYINGLYGEQEIVGSADTTQIGRVALEGADIDNGSQQGNKRTLNAGARAKRGAANVLREQLITLNTSLKSDMVDIGNRKVCAAAAQAKTPECRQLINAFKDAHRYYKEKIALIQKLNIEASNLERMSSTGPEVQTAMSEMEKCNHHTPGHLWVGGRCMSLSDYEEFRPKLILLPGAKLR